jgi:hypothetical protein
MLFARGLSLQRKTARSSPGAKGTMGISLNFCGDSPWNYQQPYNCCEGQGSNCVAGSGGSETVKGRGDPRESKMPLDNSEHIQGRMPFSVSCYPDGCRTAEAAVPIVRILGSVLGQFEPES